jgi:hypothetical protein
MPKKATVIDRAELESLLKQAEASETFPNHSQLFQHLAGKMGVSPVLIRSRVLEWHLPMKTQKGKKGRQAGVSTSKTRKGKPPEYKAALITMFAGQGVEKRVEAASRGSGKAAIALKCLDCCAGQKKEVRNCTLVACPLWAYRPWKSPESMTAKGRKAIEKGADV